MANSSLATYANITANHSGYRTQPITKITPHYMAAAWSGKQCADYFAGTGRQASSNYCVGVDGDIALSVPENCRAWTSSSEWNDQRAVTIECGNNPDSSLPDACYQSLVKLCADICKRNNIDPHYDGTINGTITMHKMFASTSCPGNWLTDRIASGLFEKDIKKAMSSEAAVVKPARIKAEKEGAVYRLYNASNGDHLYTLSAEEANRCQDKGWRYEGIAWISPKTGDLVMRLCYPKKGIHHFTSNQKEIESLKKLGWTVEGAAFRSSGSKPIWRLYNPNSDNQHVLTVSVQEHNNLAAAGWYCEGQPLRY